MHRAQSMNMSLNRASVWSRKMQGIPWENEGFWGSWGEVACVPRIMRLSVPRYLAYPPPTGRQLQRSLSDPPRRHRPTPRIRTPTLWRPTPRGWLLPSPPPVPTSAAHAGFRTAWSGRRDGRGRWNLHTLRHVQMSALRVEQMGLCRVVQPTLPKPRGVHRVLWQRQALHNPPWLHCPMILPN